MKRTLVQIYVVVFFVVVVVISVLNLMHGTGDEIYWESGLAFIIFLALVGWTDKKMKGPIISDEKSNNIFRRIWDKLVKIIVKIINLFDF